MFQPHDSLTYICHYSGVYNEIMPFIALQHTKLDPVLLMQPHTTLQLQNIVKTKRPNSLLSFWMPLECPLEQPLQMTIPLNYLTLAITNVFLKCIVNIQIQAVCLQIIMVQLRAINNIHVWKGTECWLTCTCCKFVNCSWKVDCNRYTYSDIILVSSYYVILSFSLCMCSGWLNHIEYNWKSLCEIYMYI